MIIYGLTRLKIDSFSLDNCFDGVKNGDEEGRDCGGSCDTCQEGKYLLK